MAKKTRELTLEEKLEQALVPREEWPYEVPENWCWCKVGSIITIHRGVSYKKNEAHSEKLEEDFLILRGGNIKEGNISIIEEDNVYVDASLVADNQIIKKDDILIVASTGSVKVIGRAGISYVNYKDVAFGAFLVLVRPIQKVNTRYVDYFFQSAIYRSRVRQLASGVNINNIRTEYITETPCPLPPIAEQQRIVDRIESLFAKLDEAKKIAEEIVDSFELRKSAILHKAFTGELTAKWRKEHGVGMESWVERTFDECIMKMQNGLAKRSGSIGRECVVLRLANLVDEGFDTSDLRKIVLDEKEQNSYFLNENDVLMIRVNGSKDNVGKQFLVTKDEEWAFCDHIIRIVYNRALVLSAYMVYVSKSRAYRDYVSDNMVSSAGQNTISRKGMAHLTIQLPTIPEQEVIIKSLNLIFTQEQNVVEVAEAVLAQIDTMKKAILARTFRGELGTNDKTEESSIELIKSILANIEKE